MEKSIKKLIETSKKNYDPKAQRVELLKRDETFSSELEGIKKRLGIKFFKTLKEDINQLHKKSKDNILYLMDYPKTFIFESDVSIEEVEEAYSHYLIFGEYDGYNPKAAIKRDSFFDGADLNTVIVYEVDLDNIETKIECKCIILERYREKWIEFCRKWNIYSAWDGKLPGLLENLYSFIEVQFNEDDNHFPIHIKMSAWVTRNELDEKWGEIKEIKKSIVDKRKKSEQTFGRDLCWYDLNKNPKFKKSPREIAELWEEIYPEDVDFFTLDYLMIDPHTMKDIKELIKEKGIKDLFSKKIDNKKLLMEIKTGRLSQEYGNHFKEMRVFYISGEASKKEYPPFLKTIKVAINRMEDYIVESRNIVSGLPHKHKKYEELSSFFSVSPKKYLA